MPKKEFQKLQRAGLEILEECKGDVPEDVPLHTEDPDRDAHGRFVEGNKAAAGERSLTWRDKHGVENAASRREGRRQRAKLLEAAIDAEFTILDMRAILRQMIADAKEPGNIKARKQLLDRLIGKPTYESGGVQQGPSQLTVLLAKITQIEERKIEAIGSGDEETIEAKWEEVSGEEGGANE